MIRAHGGPKNMVKAQKGGAVSVGGIVENTMANVPKMVHMKGLANLVSQTTGVPMEKPTMEGVLTKTIPAVPVEPEFRPVPKGDVGKTKTKRKGQVAYAGPEY